MGALERLVLGPFGPPKEAKAVLRLQVRERADRGTQIEDEGEKTTKHFRAVGLPPYSIYTKECDNTYATCKKIANT